MLDSITWGTWDQLQWQGENDAAAWGQGNLPVTGTTSSGSAKKMRSTTQANGANASEWRKPRPRVSDVPLFVRLLNKLEREVPFSVPEYHFAPLQTNAAIAPLPSPSSVRTTVALETQATQAIATTTRTAHSALNASLSTPGAFAVDWRHLSEAVAPSAGGLDELRAERKGQQVSNLLSATCALVDHQLALRRRNRAHTASSSASSAHANAWEPVKVVEFCGGAGYVALPLAAMYVPEDVFVLLLDMKEQSLDIARRRVASAGLTNVEVRRARLEDFSPSETFDIGVALHACGPATDLSLECCLQAGAAYVMSPCCVGKIRSSRKAGITRRAKGSGGGGGIDQGGGARLNQRDTSLVAAAARKAKEMHKAQQQQQQSQRNWALGQLKEEEGEVGEKGFEEQREDNQQEQRGKPRREEEPTDAGQLDYPRSAALRKVLSTAEWATVARAADFGHRDLSEYDAEQRKRRVAKAFVEHDRQMRAREAGYVTHTCVMAPRTATPKNDVITGWPQAWGLEVSKNHDGSNDNSTSDVTKTTNVDGNQSDSDSSGSSTHSADGNHLSSKSIDLLAEDTAEAPGSLEEKVSSIMGPNSGLGARKGSPPTLESLERFLFAPEV